MTSSLLVMLAVLSCSVERADQAATEERNGVRYLVGAVEPFSGIVFTIHGGSDQVATEVRFKRGLRHGPSAEYYPDGQRKREGEYRDGRSEGTLREWSETGQLVLERVMSGGKPHGSSTTWYPNGQIESESTYRNGSLEGSQTLWYEDGAQRAARAFRDGSQHGPGTEWYASGALRSEVNWKDGKPDGPFARWYEHGQKRAEGRYRDGDLVELRQWDEQGNELPPAPLPTIRAKPERPPT